MHRRVSSVRTGRCVVAGFAAAVLLVPGVAWADGASGIGSSPLAPDAVNGAVTNVSGSLTGTDPIDNGSTPGTGTTDSGTSGTSGAGNPVTDQAATPSPPPLPPQLQALVDAINPSAACQAAIQADLTKLLTDIPGSITAIIASLTPTGGGTPPTPDQIIAALQDALGLTPPAGGAAAPAADPPAPPDVPIVADLQQLVSDFQSAKCRPSLPPSGGTTPPTTNTPTQTQSDSQPTAQETQPAAQPAAQPVSYPGYAATGGIATTALRPASDQRSSDTLPLSVLGGIVLVSTAAAVGVRSRARRNGR